MDPVVVSGCFAITGALIGGLSTWLITRDVKRMVGLQRAVDRMAPQIKAYWHLEKLYAKKVASLTGENERNVLSICRKEIENAGYERPKMTENEVNTILDSL